MTSMDEMDKKALYFMKDITKLVDSTDNKIKMGEICLSYAIKEYFLYGSQKELLEEIISLGWDKSEKISKDININSFNNNDNNNYLDDIDGKLSSLIDKSTLDHGEKFLTLMSASIGLLQKFGANKEHVINYSMRQYEVYEAYTLMQEFSIEELFAIRRFADVGHPWFISNSPEYTAFDAAYDNKLKESGLSTSGLSKKVGLEKTPDIDKLLVKTIHSNFVKDIDLN